MINGGSCGMLQPALTIVMALVVGFCGGDDFYYVWHLWPDPWLINILRVVCSGIWKMNL